MLESSEEEEDGGQEVACRTLLFPLADENVPLHLTAFSS